MSALSMPLSSPKAALPNGQANAGSARACSAKLENANVININALCSYSKYARENGAISRWFVEFFAPKLANSALVPEDSRIRGVSVN
jgi:hypothetical protein